jgi:hypothetical protein
VRKDGIRRIGARCLRLVHPYREGPSHDASSERGGETRQGFGHTRAAGSETSRGDSRRQALCRAYNDRISRLDPCPRRGDRAEFVAGYSDSTVFLHDYLYATRQGKVETIWPILGRGMTE